MNEGSGKLLIKKECDKDIELTNMMIKDCMKNNYYLYVPHLKAKQDVLHKTRDRCKVLCPADNLKRFNTYHMIIDGDCSFQHVRNLLMNNVMTKIEIINGFVYEPLAR